MAVRVLVTGGTGYLGRALVSALVARGHVPVVFARAPKTTSGVLSVHGDVRDRDAFVAAARGCDALCHSAALVSVWRPRAADFDDVNIGGVRHALEAVRTHGLQRMVYTSSFLARPPRGRATPLAANDYQRTKTLADEVASRARAAGAPLVTLYPGVMYGPGLLSEGNLVGRLIADHLAGRLPGLLGADRIWSFAWVDAVAQAHVAALEHPSPRPSYEVGGPNLPQIRPFEVLRDLEGTPLPRRLPLWTGYPAALVEHARTALLGRPPQLTLATVKIFQHDWPLDSSAAIQDLRYTTPPIEDGIGEMVREMLA